MISIENNGMEIVNTDYLSSEWCLRGIIAASVNAGAVRLLMPPGLVGSMVPEMETGKEVIIKKGKFMGQTIYDIWFDDHTENPFRLTLGENQFIDRTIPDDESGRDVELLVYSFVGKWSKVYSHTAKFELYKNSKRAL